MSSKPTQFRLMSRLTHSRGSILVFSMVILSLITFGAVVAMKRSTLQVRMTNNMQFHMDAFTSAMDSLVVMEANLAEGDSAGLATLIAAENLDDSDFGDVTVDLYAEEGWTLPTASNAKVIDSVTNQVRVESLPEEGNGASPRENPGSSNNVIGMYTFVSQAVASDKSGNIVSTQELAFRRSGPAPN
jgi:Tfp pilus assembly protein PilX